MKTKSVIRHTVQATFVGQRLDRYLTSLPEIISRSFAQDLIEKKLVLIDGKEARASLALKLDQTIEIYIPEVAVPSELVPYDLPLDIIFEDNDLIVVNKPSGLVIHPAVGHEQDTLVNALLHHTKNLSMKNEQRPGIVHRIDKETSGLLVVAKNDLAHEKLAQQFKDKTSHRVYYAVVLGSLARKTGIAKSYLARHPSDRKRYASIRENNKIISSFDESFEDGKWAVTHYEKISQSGGMSYVKLKLETGRTHQIRVHMSEMGNPLIGDIQYGYSLQKAKNEKISRFYLHAAELGFTHPTTNEKLLFKIDWPSIDRQRIVDWGFRLEDIKI